MVRFLLSVLGFMMLVTNATGLLLFGVVIALGSTFYVGIGFVGVGILLWWVYDYLEDNEEVQIYIVFGEFYIPTTKKFLRDAMHNPSEFEIELQAMSPGFTGKFAIEDGRFIVVDMSGVESMIPVQPTSQPSAK